jgi:predicted exporter
MTRAQRGWILCSWIGALAACTAIIAQTRFTNDLSAFLPRSPSPEQQLLVEQLREGVISRLLLIAIEGSDEASLATTSKRLADALRADAAFLSVDNGMWSASPRDREILWRYRYLLSPDVAPERFSTAGLRRILEEDLELLASPAGILVSRTLAADPSGELLRALERLGGQAAIPTRHGVWFSADGKRVLLVAQTRAPGTDIDAQEQALGSIRSAFDHLQASAERLLLTGPGLFSVMTREQIRQDAWRLSIAATVLIAALLLAVYRSVRVLVLGLLPVASGAAAGIAAVSLGFGYVHGITLAFGVTLIGEGVDYAIYFFLQRPAEGSATSAFVRLWPTLRLGVLTSICGFSALLFSGFTGLSQLGLFSIVGLIVAAAVTRWVLPVLTPRGFDAVAVAVFAERVDRLVRPARRLAPAVLMLLVAAVALLVLQTRELWSTDLASLSPIPESARLLDQQLRRDLGAPDIRHLVVVQAKSDEEALQAAEYVGVALDEAVRQGLLEGFDSPALQLPSRRTQLARRAALPEPQVLSANLEQAEKGLPFRPGVFKPFVEDIVATRRLAPLERQGLAGSRLALKVDTLLVHGERGWSAMLPLRGVHDAGAIARRVAAVSGVQSVLLDLKRESDTLYRAYLHEALEHALAGAAAILVLLAASLRSARRVFDVVAPLAAAVILDAALFAVLGEQLSIFHLVGLLLVVAVGSNYSLFFDRLASYPDQRARTLASVLFAALCTVIGFGVLAFSRVPVLHAIGSTVAIGALLALLFSATFSRHARAV